MVVAATFKISVSCQRRYKERAAQHLREYLEALPQAVAGMKVEILDAE